MKITTLMPPHLDARREPKLPPSCFYEEDHRAPVHNRRLLLQEPIFNIIIHADQVHPQPANKLVINPT
jgi:hypothetical protein